MEMVNKGDLLIYRNGRECFVTGIKEEWFATEIVRTINLSDNAYFLMDSTDKLSDWGIVKVIKHD
jgi:hypothetical protein